MKVFVAGSPCIAAQAREVSRTLAGAGLEVVSTWHNQVEPGRVAWDLAWAEIQRADGLVLVTGHEPGEEPMPEPLVLAGFALGRGLLACVIGEWFPDGLPRAEQPGMRAVEWHRTATDLLDACAADHV